MTQPEPNYLDDEKHPVEQELDELRNEVSSHRNPRLEQEGSQRMKALFG